MPSPFPGMNPYLEQDDTWDDFHHNYVVRAREILARLLGRNYFAKIAVRSYVHKLSEGERRYFPYTEVQKQPFLEIRDRRNRRLVTVIEVLSPANKDPGQNQTAYLGKRKALLAGSAHLVEIDLRRGGSRPQPPILPACDYYALVSRKLHRPKFEFWPIRLRERLPVIPVPLNDGDPDVEFDLQEVVHRVYDAADYAKYIYSETPDPPLAPDDAAWAKSYVPRKDGK